MNKQGKLIVISGPSGVGKGTLIRSFLDSCSDLTVSISATTRTPREGEVDGVHYYFITREKFETIIENGGMLEYANYNDNYYGTPKATVEKNTEKGINVILEIEVQGARQIKKLCSDAVFIFIMPPSIEVLEKRLTDRNTEGCKTIKQRLAISKEEISHANEYDYVVINDVLERAKNELLDILKEINKN